MVATKNKNEKKLLIIGMISTFVLGFALGGIFTTLNKSSTGSMYYYGGSGVPPIANKSFYISQSKTTIGPGESVTFWVRGNMNRAYYQIGSNVRPTNYYNPTIMNRAITFSYNQLSYYHNKGEFYLHVLGENKRMYKTVKVKLQKPSTYSCNIKSDYQKIELSKFDYDNNNRIDTDDTKKLLNIINGRKKCISGKECDVNNDGRVNILDSTKLIIIAKEGCLAKETKYCKIRTAEEKVAFSKFDYNNNTFLDEGDSKIIANIVVGKDTCLNGKDCDVDKDGRISILDSLKLAIIIKEGCIVKKYGLFPSVKTSLNSSITPKFKVKGIFSGEAQVKMKQVELDKTGTTGTGITFKLYSESLLDSILGTGSVDKIDGKINGNKIYFDVSNARWAGDISSLNDYKDFTIEVKGTKTGDKVQLKIPKNGIKYKRGSLYDKWYDNMIYSINLDKDVDLGFRNY